MHITPLDLRKQTFNKKMMGFDPDEVRSFLDMIASEMEIMNKERQEREEHIKAMENQLHMFKKMEQNMQDTLLTAQRVTDEIKVNAQKEAELIIKDAQIRAHKEVEAAREKTLQFDKELTTLRHQREMFISRFRSLVNTQLEMLAILERDDESDMLEQAPEPTQPNHAPIAGTVPHDNPDSRNFSIEETRASGSESSIEIQG